MFIEVNNELKFFKLSDSFLSDVNLIQTEVIKNFFEQPKKYYQYIIGNNDSKEYLNNYQKNQKLIEEMIED